MADFRETTVTVTGTTRTIRTERIGTVKQLEAAHTKAVKAALVEMRKAAIPALRERRDPALGPLIRLAWFAEQVAQWEKGTFAPTPGTYSVAAMRKPWPKPTRRPVPEYLVEVAPGEFATREAAEAMGVEEYEEEILPGLTVGREGKYWVLHHPRSTTTEKPRGYHVGPLYRTKADARKSALTELAGFDWTRSQAELVADERVKVTVKWIKSREWAARKPSEAWRREDAQKAYEALRALRGPESVSA